MASTELEIVRSGSSEFIVQTLPDGSTAIFEVATKNVYSLNPSAAAAWEACASATTLSQLAAAMSRRLNTPVTEDLAHEAVSELVAVGLVDVTPAERFGTSRRAMLKQVAGVALPVVLVLTGAEQRRTLRVPGPILLRSRRRAGRPAHDGRSHDDAGPAESRDARHHQGLRHLTSRTQTESLGGRGVRRDLNIATGHVVAHMRDGRRTVTATSTVAGNVQAGRDVCATIAHATRTLSSLGSDPGRVHSEPGCVPGHNQHNRAELTTTGIRRSLGPLSPRLDDGTSASETAPLTGGSVGERRSS